VLFAEHDEVVERIRDRPIYPMSRSTWRFCQDPHRTKDTVLEFLSAAPGEVPWKNGERRKFNLSPLD